MEIINTPIKGLKIKLNKVIGDERGYLAELLPKGTKNELIGGKIGNIYLSLATKKGVARGGHYHHNLVETFYTLSGTTLWLFKDFRKDSESFGKTYVALAGEKSEKVDLDIPSYFLPESMAQFLVPAGVYHIYYPLTNKRVEILSIGSLPYDNTDYVKFRVEEDKDLRKIIQKYV